MSLSATTTATAKTALKTAQQRWAARQSLPISTVYAIGDGWTGALGTGRLDLDVRGHEDGYSDQADLPAALYTGRVLSAAAGWAHTALVVEDNPGRELLVTGRPHEFQSLLRLQRLPRAFRKYAARDTYRTTHEEVASWSLDPVDFLGRFMNFLISAFQLGDPKTWEEARQQSFTKELRKIPLDKSPVAVQASAGWTALTTSNGAVYTFGLNQFGQCGHGDTSNNVWWPKPLTGLSTEFATGKREELEQSYPITDLALGLQHGVCLNSQGEMFSWGKGLRGQLGHEDVEFESYTAVPIQRAMKQLTPKPLFTRLGKISQIASGMIHAAALEHDTNDVYIWGKHVIPLLDGETKRNVAASDARIPVRLAGLPENLRVLQLSCGSHHTAVLLEDGSVWAVGITTDSRKPQLTPVQLIEPGIIELPVRQFRAHMDRTTVVGRTGQQILQVHLWEDEKNRECAVFTPAWVDHLLEHDPQVRIREIHRSWLHTVIVTDKEHT